MRVSDFLKKLREAKGLTQEGVADKLNVSTNTVQNWERTCKFRTSEDLHSLLDLYEVDDSVRNFIVIAVYGRKSEGSEVTTKKEPECVILKEAVERLASEKDAEKYVPYPLDKTCTCLDVVENRIKGLETAVQYVEKFYISKEAKIISGWETAILIDAIGREYGVEIGAAGVYQIQENNVKASVIFPFGDEEGWTVYSEEYRREMDYEEYFGALSEKVEVNRSSLEEQEKALGAMKKDLLELRVIRERILAYICNQGCWEDCVDVSGLLDVYDGMFWEIVSIQRTGKAYKKASTLDRMKRFLDEKDFSIDRRLKWKEKRMDVHCDAIFYNGGTVEKALHVMRRVLEIMPYDDAVIDVDEWEKVCRESSLLNERILLIK